MELTVAERVWADIVRIKTSSKGKIHITYQCVVDRWAVQTDFHCYSAYTYFRNSFWFSLVKLFFNGDHWNKTLNQFSGGFARWPKILELPWIRFTWICSCFGDFWRKRTRKKEFFFVVGWQVIDFEWKKNFIDIFSNLICSFDAEFECKQSTKATKSSINAIENFFKDFSISFYT